MRRFKITAPREALKAPEILFKIWAQLKTQEPAARRVIEIKELGICGEVEGLKPSEPLSPLIELIKSRAQRPRGGEVEVIKELSGEMLKSYTTRMSALNAELELMAEQSAPLNKARTFKPPKAAQENARRGLKLRRKHGRGGMSTAEAGAEGIGSGVQRAVNLARGDKLSLDTLKMMRGFFNRHQQHRNSRHKDGTHGAGAIAWLLWGGDEGRAWVERTLEREDEI